MRNPFRRKKQSQVAPQKGPDDNERATVVTKEPSEIETTEGKLLVMGRESRFSNEVIDYAIDMARRMSFEIIALNSAPLSCDAFSLLSDSQKKLCREFQSISEENAMAFQSQAEANGIPFTHLVKYDAPEKALANVQKEYGNIEFVISEPQAPAITDQAAQSNRPRSEVLVYSMI
ncbi:MAG: hypothetical protein P8010_26790 [Desulfosarcinaceae bacterium]